MTLTLLGVFVAGLALGGFVGFIGGMALGLTAGLFSAAFSVVKGRCS
jgi:hypothetical protein